MTSKEKLAEALLIRRWTLHTTKGTMGFPTAESEAAAYEAVDLAREFGCLPEFMAVLMRLPILTVTVAEMDRPPKPKARGGRKKG